MSVIAPFSNHLPVRIRFGDGVAQEIAGLARDAGRGLVVVDAGLAEASAHVRAALDALRAGGAAVLERAPGEPKHSEVDTLAARIAADGPAVIVAIGGGSTIDVAKAARLVCQIGGTFEDYVERRPDVPEPQVALIAVPTTAGTGSEVSGGSVVTVSDGRKVGIAHPLLRAQHAVVDPQLTWSVPPKQTAYTGVDALAQAIAGMVVSARTPIGDAIALESIRLIGGSLLRACQQGDDPAARNAMACGSLLAGLTMNISDCGAEHAIGQAIASHTPAPHGLTVGVVLAAVLDRERAHVPQQLERVADALGRPGDGSADGSRAVAAIQELLTALGFETLADLPLADEDFDAVAATAERDYFLTMSPSPWSTAEIRTVLEASRRR